MRNLRSKTMIYRQPGFLLSTSQSMILQVYQPVVTPETKPTQNIVSSLAPALRAAAIGFVITSSAVPPLRQTSERASFQAEWTASDSPHTYRTKLEG